MKRTLALSMLLLVAAGCKGKQNLKKRPRPTQDQSQDDKQKDKDQDPIDILIKSGRLPQLDQSASLAGTDSDGNGIRDDIDAQIAKFSISDSQKSAARNYARAVQMVMTSDLKGEKELREVSSAYMLSELCLYRQFNDEDRSIQRSVVNTVRSYTWNTKARNRQYFTFDSMMHGRAFTMPSVTSCAQLRDGGN